MDVVTGIWIACGIDVAPRRLDDQRHGRHDQIWITSGTDVVTVTRVIGGMDITTAIWIISGTDVMA